MHEQICKDGEIEQWRNAKEAPDKEVGPRVFLSPP
jgi:hypothetical protein